jgi:hypothetical protein
VRFRQPENPIRGQLRRKLTHGTEAGDYEECNQKRERAEAVLRYHELARQRPDAEIGDRALLG